MSTPSNNAIKTIHDSLKGSFNNTVTFPEHVKAVVAVGVIRYEVDLVKKIIIYHFSNNTTHQEILPHAFQMVPNSLFVLEAVKAAITAIQKKQIDYPTFLNQIMVAGTECYEVDITAGHVIYSGHQDQHVEKFPALPKP